MGTLPSLQTAAPRRRLTPSTSAAFRSANGSIGATARQYLAMALIRFSRLLRS